MDSLNTKGIREKNLHENLQNLVKNKLVELESSKPEIIEIDDDEIHESKREMNGELKDSQDESMNIDEKTTPSTLSATKAGKDTLDYWHAKVLEYELNKNDETSRTTRYRQKQPKKEANEDSYTNYKNFTLEKIKERIKKTEKSLSEYLDKWGSRWAKPSVKEEIMTMLDYADKAPEIANVLLRLNEEWQKCESIRKRPKYEQDEGDGNASDSNSAKVDKSSDAQSENKDDEEFYFDSNDKKAGKGEDKSKTKKPKNQLDFDDFDVSKYKLKKIHLRIWSLNLERLKRCWIAVTSAADNMSAIYFSTVLFCDLITKYCEKKAKHYFTEKKPKPQSAILAQQKAKEDRNRYLAPPKRPVQLETEESDESEEEKEKYSKVSQNEKTRAKQEKMDELLAIQESGVRRSGRNFNKRKMVIEDDDYEDENEEEEDEEEDGEEEEEEEEQEEKEPEDPENVKCKVCAIKYRLEDLGLDSHPKGGWECFDCIDKRAAQRRTRSSRR